MQQYYDVTPDGMLSPQQGHSAPRSYSSDFSDPRMNHHQQSMPQMSSHDEEDEEDTGDYWIPGEGEFGLTEVVEKSEGEPVLLCARPVPELKGNFFDYQGAPVNLHIPIFTQGKAAAFQSASAGIRDAARYLDLAQNYSAFSTKEYMLVRYRDWSRWASRRHPREARGGFGSPTEEGRFPVVLNPFSRSYVDRFFAVEIGAHPAQFVPITEGQFFCGVNQAHDNYLKKGKELLTEEQFAAIRTMSARDVPEMVEDEITYGWVTAPDPRKWAKHQQMVISASAVLLLLGTWRGKRAGPVMRVLSSKGPTASDATYSHIGGLFNTMLWMGFGALTSWAAGIFAGKGNFPLTEVPLNGLASAVMAWSTLSMESRPQSWAMVYYNLIAFGATYKLALSRRQTSSA